MYHKVISRKYIIDTFPYRKSWKINQDQYEEDFQIYITKSSVF